MHMVRIGWVSVVADWLMGSLTDPVLFSCV